MDTLGTRLKRTRERAGLSASELSQLAGLKNTSHVGMIERGARPGISATTAVGLAQALGCNVVWLVTGLGSEPDYDTLRASVARARTAIRRKEAA
jgi:transcriptional regulator with XRE-family HTH domain